MLALLWLQFLLGIVVVAALDVSPGASSISRRHAISVASSVLTTTTATSRSRASESEASTLPPTLASTVTVGGPAGVRVPSINLPNPTNLKSPLNAKPFPLASFGLQIYDNDAAYKLTLTALKAGYRNFFASVLAGNQKGFAKAIKDSGIPREELYICGTVLSNRAKNYRDASSLTTRGCMENLDVMQKNSNGVIDYLDMIMLDYPCLVDEGILGQWDAFCAFQNDAHVVHLAVSNFNARQLDLILTSQDKKKAQGDGTAVQDGFGIPVVNQLPFSIANHPKGIMEQNQVRNVHVQSWSPLSSTLPRYRSTLAEIGSKYGKSDAQVGLKWIVQNGGSYCVQSKKERHFVENLDIFDFELSDRDMQVLTDLQPPVEF